MNPGGWETERFGSWEVEKVRRPKFYLYSSTLIP
jgi:hypothetical protein